MNPDLRQIRAFVTVAQLSSYAPAGPQRAFHTLEGSPA